MACLLSEVYVNIQTCVSMDLHPCGCTYVPEHTHTFGGCVHMCVFVHTCVRMCTHANTYMYTGASAHLPARMFVHVFTCACACVCVCVYAVLFRASDGRWEACCPDAFPRDHVLPNSQSSRL